MRNIKIRREEKETDRGQENVANGIDIDRDHGRKNEATKTGAMATAILAKIEEAAGDTTTTTDFAMPQLLKWTIHPNYTRSTKAMLQASKILAHSLTCTT
jgi:hypothetical protein